MFVCLLVGLLVCLWLWWWLLFVFFLFVVLVVVLVVVCFVFGVCGCRCFASVCLSFVCFVAVQSAMNLFGCFSHLFLEVSGFWGD